MHRFRLLGLLTFMFGVAFTSQAVAFTSTYLRPDADIELNRWSIVGAKAGWDALDDAIDETKTPSATDYITVSQSNARLAVDLTSTSLKEQTTISISAWFYTGTSAAVTYFIKHTAGKNEVVLASGSVSSVGWHEIPLSPQTSQAELDRLSFLFRTESGTSTRQVDTAFVKLVLDPYPSSIYWGAWIDGDVYTENPEELGDAPWNSTTWDTFEFNAEKSVSVVHFGQPAPWNQKFAPGPLDLSRERGAIPMMDMDPDGVALSKIAEKGGSYESSLKEWAEDAKEYAQPFFFRWAWEMNGEWFTHGQEAVKSPATYIAAWRRFHDIAEEAGAKNITWVWCPNIISPGGPSLASLYPGDAYVDWTCIDGYNFGGGGWTTFSNLFTPTYLALLELARTKPVMIGETASNESGGSKAEWINSTLTKLRSEFPQVRAFLWFNWNITEEGVQRHWQIESSTASREAFSAAISSSYFAPGSFSESTPLTRIQPLP